jgi:hypothetical protein
VTTVVLLRASADGPEVTGLFEERDDDDELTLSFRYRVMRVWQRPVEELLTSSLRHMPLAPLAAIEPVELPAVLHRIDDQLAQEADPGLADLLRAAAFLMLDLRYDRNQYREILQGMIRWRESGAYQMILEQGQLSEARRLLLTFGTQRLGQPDSTIREQVEAIDDLDRLERMVGRAFTTLSWQELLATD